VEEVAAAIAAFQAPAGGERREGVELVFFPDVLTDRSCVPKKIKKFYACLKDKENLLHEQRHKSGVFSTRVNAQA
jgi:hypothetical protein